MRSSLRGGFHGFDERTQAAQLRHKYPRSFWLRTRTAKTLQVLIGIGVLWAAAVKGHNYLHENPIIAPNAPTMENQIHKTQNEVSLLLVAPTTFQIQESK